MFIHYYYKNNKKSRRTYLSDYSQYSDESKIDMTLSGKFLTKYDKINIDDIDYDKYYSKNNIIKLENKIKNKYNISKEIIITSGANGALQNIIKILFTKPGRCKNLVTPFYTFDQAEYAATSFGGYTKRVYCENYMINLNNLKKSIDSNTRMIYLCNPNNPTGIYIEPNKIIEFAKLCNKLVVVDESAIEYTNKKSILNFNDIPDNIIVLRSFSKAYGLAGLRIGYIVCSDTFKKKYIENITINEVSSISYNIVDKIIDNNDLFITNNIKLVIKERENIVKSLKKLNINCINSDSNIIMTETTFSKEFFKNLDKENVLVIPVIDENNKVHLRIAIQDEETNKLFIEKVRKVLKVESSD